MKFTKFAFLASAALLASCASQNKLPPETLFRSDSPKAMVVFGFGCQFWATYCESAIGKMKENGEIDFSIPRLISKNYGIFTETSEENMKGLVNYNTFITEPGEYSLMYFSSNTPPSHIITNIHKKDKALFKIILQAGKVHYIGDSVVNVKDTPGRLISYRHDTNRIKDYMGQFKNITEPTIVTRFEEISDASRK